MLALEVRHFINGGRTIVVEQQVDKDNPQIIPHLKTDASYRQVDLHRWLGPLLTKLGLYEEGMGWHSFKRFRNSWLREQRCHEDLRKFWLALKPKEMGEVYSALKENVPLRLAEAERCGHGFTLPRPNPMLFPMFPENPDQNQSHE